VLDSITQYIQRQIGRWKVVIDYMAAPCDTPFWAALKLLPRALKRPMIMMLDFGWGDVARGALRPKAVYRSRHGRIGRRKGGFDPFPDLGNEIGKQLPGSERLRGRSIGTPERLLWVADGILQRAGWYLLVGDAITTLAYDWVNLLRAEGYCQRPNIKAGLVYDGTYTGPRQGGPMASWTKLPTATKPPPWAPNNPFMAWLSVNAQWHYIYALATLRNPSYYPKEFVVSVKDLTGQRWTDDSRPWVHRWVPPGTAQTVAMWGTAYTTTVAIDAQISGYVTPEAGVIDWHYLIAGAPRFFPEYDPPDD